jgi:hypothetical protein
LSGGRKEFFPATIKTPFTKEEILSYFSTHAVIGELALSLLKYTVEFQASASDKDASGRPVRIDQRLYRPIAKIQVVAMEQQLLPAGKFTTGSLAGVLVGNRVPKVS